LGQNSYDFSSGGDIVSVSNFPFGFFNSQGWSVSVWVNANDTSDGFFVRQRPGGSNNYSVQIRNGVYFIQESNGRITGPPVETGTWKMLTAVYFKNSHFIFYIDGVEYDRSVLNTNLNGSSTLGIGGGADNDTGYVNSQISEVRFYDRALTPAEIQYVYNVSKRGRFVSRKKKV
jgi:hypothetical protein